MIKYSEQFKLAVVRDYLDAGSAGFRAVAQRHGLPSHSIVERWVAAYQLHGDAGLRRKLVRYSGEFKLSVLQHMWDNQVSIPQAAVKFDIRNHSAVGMWERAYQQGGFEALARRPKGRSKTMATPPTKPEDSSNDDKRSREELLAELNHLRMENAYLKKLRALVQAQQKAIPPKRRK
jgi:transposase